MKVEVIEYCGAVLYSFHAGYEFVVGGFSVVGDICSEGRVIK